MITRRIVQKCLSDINILIIIWILVCIEVSQQVDTMNKMKVVKDKIFKTYDKTIRPTNGTNTTEVYTAFLPRQIIEFNEELSLFTLDSFLFMHWLDPRLKWNTSDYDGFMSFKSDMIWTPDLSVYNSHSAKVDPTFEAMLSVHSSGVIYYFPPVQTQTSCEASNLKSYPYDEVECVIVLGSWSHDGWEIDFSHASELELYEFVNINSKWELIIEKASVERNETYYECCQEPYISIHVHMPIRRRPVPEIEATRVPCILVMILTLSIFWLPVDSSKKLLMGGILFLALNILLIYVAFSTKNPLAVLSGVSFIQTAMYLVVITLLLQVFAVIKIASLSGPSHPPSLVVPILTGPLGKYMLLRNPLSEDKVPLDQMQLNEDSNTKERISVRDEWKLFATAIDRALFFVMIIVMIAVHHI